MKHEKMKKLTVLAMLSAIAYVAVALLRFPVVLFLSYEPKDVVIAMGRWPHWASRLSSRSSRC